MTVTRYRIQFESISAIRYPHMYDQRTDRAIKVPGISHAEALAAIPDDWWTETSREDTSETRVRDQFDGLVKLIDEGEWIRNVRLSKADVLDWVEIDHA